MTKTHPAAEPENRPSRKGNVSSLRLFGFSPAVLLLAFAAACLAIGLWGVYTGNWVLVTAEAPSVIGLVIVAMLVRVATSGGALAKAAATVGFVCLLEIAVAAFVLNAHGLRLAVIVALSTGLTVVAGAAYWLVRGNQRFERTQQNDTLRS